MNTGIGFTFTLISMLSLGVGNFLYKKSTETLGPMNTTFFYYLFSIILVSIFWFLKSDKPAVTSSSLVWPALMAVFISVSVFSFSYALKSVDVSIASTVRGLAFLATIALACIFYKEELSPKDIVAICLAVSSVVIFGIEPGRLFK